METVIAIKDFFDFWSRQQTLEILKFFYFTIFKFEKNLN